MSKTYDNNSETEVTFSGFFDPITRIANQKRFDARLAQEIKRANNIISYLSILFVDIDYLQNYIDIYGKQNGENCLRQVTSALTCSFNRSGDLATRWDDTKFICLLTDTDATGSIKMAEKVKKRVANLNIPFKESPVSPVITISIGVVTALLTDETSSNELLQNADQALCRAQDLGHNQIYFWKK